MEILGEGQSAGHGGSGARLHTVLVLCPTHRDHRELKRLFRPGTTYLYHDYASTSLEELIGGKAADDQIAADPLAEVERILAKIGGLKIEAVVSTDDYPGSALAAVVARELGLPGPAPALNLICQHKYLSRLAQSALFPAAVPPFALIDVADDGPLPEALAYPVLVKPVKSFFSIGAETVASRPDLAAAKAYWSELDQFFLPLERLLRCYLGIEIGSKRLIAEGLLQGKQVTVEGYVFGGEVGVLGVVDSVMFPGTRVFSRFDYPSALPRSVQARMEEIAKVLMGGLGFDNGMFNIEMMYDARTGRIGIIEINPRMASQFADLYEKVDGTNSYTVLLDIAGGRAPVIRGREGAHAFAASCVLRCFEDGIFAALPGEEEFAVLARRHPDIRIELHGAIGRRLSDDMQDGHSFRYGIINLGGRDRDDVLAKFEACRQALGISLLPVDALPPVHDTIRAAEPRSAAQL